MQFLRGRRARACVTRERLITEVMMSGKLNAASRDKLYKSAKSYMESGASIVVLRAACAEDHNSGKVPATKHGLQDATKSFAVFRQLTDNMESFNIGIATGLASGFVVIDIDPRNGGNDTMLRLKEELGPLPRTARVNTSEGGRHLYFAA